MDDVLNFLKAADTPIALAVCLAVIIWQFRDRKSDRRMVIANQKALISLLEQSMDRAKRLAKEDSDEPRGAKT